MVKKTENGRSVKKKKIKQCSLLGGAGGFYEKYSFVWFFGFGNWMQFSE